MDSKHREELETNDLADFVENFGSWWKKHGNRLLTVVLIAALAFAGWRFYIARTAAALEDNWSQLALAAGAPEFRGLADQTADPAVRTLALLRAADALRTQNGQADAASQAKPEPTIDTPRTDRERRLLEAKALYQRVIDEAHAPVYVFNAKLGLAAVMETMADRAAAADLYRALAADAKDSFPMIAAQARSQLTLLDRLASPIAFAPEPPEAPEVSPQAPAPTAPAAD